MAATAEMTSVTEDSRATTWMAVANRVAGPSSKCDLRAVEAQLRESLGAAFAGMHIADPESLEATLKQVTAEGPDALIVVGGDGTARAAAKVAIAAPSNTAIVPLPAGTMNVLPRLVLGHDDLQRAIAELPTLAPSTLPAGLVGGEPFFLSAAFGYAASLARLREAMRPPRRWRDVATAAAAGVRASVHALRGGPDWRVEGGRWNRAHTLVIALESVSRVLAPETDHPAPRCLEVAALRLGSALDALRLGGVWLTSDWRRSRHVQITRTRHVEVRVRSRRPMVVLDGEPLRVAKVDAVQLIPDAIAVLAPPNR